jgi:hypothetical protein
MTSGLALAAPTSFLWRLAHWAPSAGLIVAVAACGDGPSADETGAGDAVEVDTGYEGDESDGKPDLVCLPGTLQCAGDTTLEVCAETGLEWEQMPCSSESTCVPCEEEDGESCTPQCKGPCDSEDDLPSSAGCSFIASRMIRDEFDQEDEVDGLIVGNPNTAQTATVTLFQVPEGKRQEELVGEPVELGPGEEHVFELDANYIDITGFSRFRTGGNYRVQSDIPIIAYLHSPWRATRGNDASLLLPEDALRGDYVIASYIPEIEPSYFTVIALEDDTVLEWTPLKTDTAGNGFPIDLVKKGKKGKLAMGRFDSARIAASTSTMPNPNNRDVSGTVLHSNKPIWVMGAVMCARVPPGKNWCDHLQEQMLPLEYWGTKYVAAPSPERENEPHIWRVYAAAPDGATITADPPVIEPIVLEARGHWQEFQVPHGTAFVLESDRPFMPVQYLVGQELAKKEGDPSMYQSVPVEQFLNRYVFVTGLDFDSHYVQVIRHLGGADVFVDDELVSGYYSVGNFEIVDVEIDEGSHVAESADDFGIVQVGYTLDTTTKDASYAYPGGMKAEEIYIP